MIVARPLSVAMMIASTATPPVVEVSPSGPVAAAGERRSSTATGQSRDV